MYRTILVPLDGSERAEAILPHVEDLAPRYGAKVIFLQVIELESSEIMGLGMATYSTSASQNLEQRMREAKMYLTTQQRKFQEKGIEVQTYVAHGPVVEVIINTAERSQADLIAMASHGRSGLSRVFYGSVAAGVLHRVDRPLLLIRSLDNV
jgi:nucleotide-binding universal stress UspA family protein